MGAAESDRAGRSSRRARRRGSPRGHGAGGRQRTPGQRATCPQTIQDLHPRPRNCLKVAAKDMAKIIRARLEGVRLQLVQGDEADDYRRRPAASAISPAVVHGASVLSFARSSPAFCMSAFLPRVYPMGGKACATASVSTSDRHKCPERRGQDYRARTSYARVMVRRPRGMTIAPRWIVGACLYAAGRRERETIVSLALSRSSSHTRRNGGVNSQPAEAAASAQLRYVSDERPGI